MRRAVALLGLTLAGCRHVAVLPPPPDASEEVRRDAYEQLKPVGRDTLVRVVRGRQIVEEPTETVILGNGQEVHHPDDLLPAVKPDSPTATNVEQYLKRSEPWKLWGGLAAGGFIGGAAFIGSSIWVDYGNARGYVLLGGLALAILVPIASLIVGAVLVGDTSADRDRCFQTYDADLRDYLGLTAPAVEGAAPP